MTARKAPHHPPTDWVRIINAIFAGVVMVMMTYFSVRQHTIGNTVEQVKKQTDGARTASLLAVAISARSLAVATKSPDDEKTALEAEAAYRTQLEIQRKSEQD